MFLEPVETPYDLRFHFFGTPVRVNIWFWVFSAVLNWEAYNRGGIGSLALWIGCVFVSVLLHELGHVWMGQAFGASSYIVLYSFGGLAVGSNRLARRWQRVCVSLAGPGIQLALFLLIYAFLKSPLGSREFSPMAEEAISYLSVINFIWPLFNFLPIWPLDGGQVCREVMEGANPRRGMVLSLWISTITAGALAVHCLLAQSGARLIPYVPGLGLYGVFLFAMLAMGSWQALQAERTRGRDWDDARLPWQQ